MQPSTHSRSRKRSKTITSLLLLMLGVALFATVLFHVGIPDLDKLQTVKPTFVVAGVAALAVIMAIMATRWRTFVVATGGSTVSWMRFFRCCSGMVFAGLFIPKDLADLGGRTYWLRKTGTRSGLNAGSTVFMDRMCDVIILACTLPWSLLALTRSISLPVALALMVCTICAATSLLAVFRIPLFTFLQYILCRLASLVTRIPWLAQWTFRPLDITTPSPRVIVISMLLSAIKPAAMALQYSMYALAFGLELPLTILAVGIPVCQAAFVFSFTAGGLGMLEAGWLGVFTLAGVSSDDVGLFILGQRLLDYLCVGIAFGLIQLTTTVWGDK